MDADTKKTALRMIPYGIYVLTAQAPDGTIAAATVNWVTQTSFEGMSRSRSPGAVRLRVLQTQKGERHHGK